MLSFNFAPADVGHAIQLAMAPAFLLTGIAGLLNVMAGRLARIIDRGRAMAEGRVPLQGDAGEAAAVAQVELAGLELRRRWASWAINFCTLAALLVCAMIAALFAEALLGLSLKGSAGILFMVATLALTGGLGCFLREVHLATHTIRIPSHIRSR